MLVASEVYACRGKTATQLAMALRTFTTDTATACEFENGLPKRMVPVRYMKCVGVG